MSVVEVRLSLPTAEARDHGFWAAICDRGSGVVGGGAAVPQNGGRFPRAVPTAGAYTHTRGIHTYTFSYILRQIRSSSLCGLLLLTQNVISSLDIADIMNPNSEIQGGVCDAGLFVVL